jgi:arylformamidase
MPGLYRQFDRAALDREYSPSLAAGGDAQPWIDRYARLSQEVCALPGFIADIAYGEHPDEILDLFLPPGHGPWPLHVFIHGGYWQSLTQRDFAFIGPSLQRRGAAFASLNYTVAPAASIGRMIDQCGRAMRFLSENAAGFGLDPGRMTVSGHSAGAHLAAMLLADPVTRDLIAGALLISGVYDLEPIRLSYVDAPLHLTADDVAAWSPMLIPVSPEAPCAIVWGERDTGEFRRQSRDFADKLSASGRPVRRMEFAGRNHFDIVLEFLHDDSRLAELALRP